jgi:alkyldihydroxyacetonephosphate synthase
MHELQRQMIESELVDISGREYVLSDEADRAIYGVDYFWVPRMFVDRGSPLPLPDLVVLPGTVEEVAAIVKLANVHRIPLIAWGGGSGSQGGIVPVYGGITLDLKRLSGVVEINAKAQTVTAGAGINGYELESTLNAVGLTLPHYPASVHSATLGGYLACRGSGVLSTKYGKAEDLVLSIQVVLPTGEIMRTLPVPSHAAGPGILDFFVGSEGSYGIITEATMSVVELPEERRFQSLIFDDLADGLEAGRRMMHERLEPCVIRLYDEPSSIKVIGSILGEHIDSGVYMVIGFDGRKSMVDLQESRALEICRELGAQELGAEHGSRWWKHRYDFYFPPHVFDLPMMFGTLDTVCTYDNIEKLYTTKKRVLEEKYAEWGLQYYAHFSHWYPWGVMVYDRFAIADPPSDTGEALALHNEIWNLAVRTSISCGGVLNDHHGVGLKLARLVREQYGTAFKVLDGLKRSLDPRNILNPGKMGFGPPT